MTRRCSRCHRRLRNNTDGWNATFDRGVIVGLICPGCQTPEENAEAVINEATTDYDMIGGLYVGRPKFGGAG